MFEYFLVTIHFWILSKKRKIHFWIREAEFGFYQRNKFALFSSRKLPFCNFFFSRGRLKIARSAFRKIYKLLLQEYVFLEQFLRFTRGHVTSQCQTRLLRAIRIKILLVIPMLSKIDGRRELSAR